MNDHHTATLAHYQGLVDQLAAEDAALEKYRTEFAEVERLQARVAELKFLAERLQHCAQGFYVDQGDYGHMEAIMQDYHSSMRADKAEGADNAK